MMRVHRLLRESHAQRKKRRERLIAMNGLDDRLIAPDMTAAVSKMLRGLEKDGFIEPPVFDALENRLVAALVAVLNEDTTERDVFERLFVDLVEGRAYKNRLDKQIAVAAQAAVFAALEERVAVALHQVMRKLFLRDHMQLPVDYRLRLPSAVAANVDPDALCGPQAPEAAQQPSEAA